LGVRKSGSRNITLKPSDDLETKNKRINRNDNIRHTNVREKLEAVQFCNNNFITDS
jgi:hypothetical protein